MSDNEKWQKIKEDSESTLDESVEDEFAEEEDDTELSHDAVLEHPSYAALEEKLTLSEQKAHENWEKSVRAMAELENVRRRAERDVTNAHRYGLEKLISSMLPVMDSLEQALQLVDEATQPAMYEGLQLTMKLFLDTLHKQDVTQIDPLGQPFNPQEHEAMSIQDAPDAAPNSVVVVFQKGYKLNDRVIRPARVIVAKSKSMD